MPRSACLHSTAGFILRANIPLERGFVPVRRHPRSCVMRTYAFRPSWVRLRFRIREFRDAPTPARTVARSWWGVLLRGPGHPATRHRTPVQSDQDGYERARQALGRVTMQSSAGPRHLGDLPLHYVAAPRLPGLCSLPTSGNGPKYEAFVALWC